MESKVQPKKIEDDELRITDSDSTDFSNSAASSRSGSRSRPTSRANTPGPMPNHQYDKNLLMEIRDQPLARKRPTCLSPDHDNPDGYWDPDIWFRSFDKVSSRGSSPLTTGTAGPKERKRPAELERDVLFKRKTSADPKSRLREEEEDGLGIVLSPQRRSFGTGCHVSFMPPRRPTSPNEQEREAQASGRDHRKVTKIGSGRIQIAHEHHEREYRDTRSRYDRDDHGRPFDPPNPLDRFNSRDRERDRNNVTRDRERDSMTRDSLTRERDGTSRESRDRDNINRDNRETMTRERDSMSRDNISRVNMSRDNMSRDNMSRDNMNRDRFHGREFDRRYDNRGMRRDYHRRQEAEPEWFTSGPSSQHDVIELHGFEGPSKESAEQKEQKKKPKEKQQGAVKERGAGEKKPGKDEVQRTSEVKRTSPRNQEEEDYDNRPRSRTGSLNVADRNGSLETNESSSPEGSPHRADKKAGPPAASAPDFDFNEFFKIDNIPGLVDTAPVEQEAPAGGSRFSQWFQISASSHPGSRNDSRRSSINEEFGYLNDLLNLSGGQKSPVIPSPPLMDPHAMIPMTRGGPDARHFVSEQQQNNILEMLKKAGATPGRIPVNFMMPHDIHQQEHSQGPHKPLAVREMEANIKALLMRGTDGGTPPAPVDQSHKPFSPQQGVSGKITTVSELEADLNKLGLTKDAQAAAAITAANKQSSVEQMLRWKEQASKLEISPHQTSPPDMGAYNKLLGMMKASGVLQDTPKMPKKQDGRPLSPVNIANILQKDMAAQQKDIMQKILQHQQAAKVIQQQQQQQTKIQAQQQVKQIHQQKQVQDQILKFMKQNPGLMPKAGATSSPISPSLNALQPPASPRCPSPAIPQQALLQPQQSPSPRAPSPIMFGSQPPMHLTAPSPIHPTQIPPTSQTLSPNTLQVGQGNNVRMMQRVPSPQELIVHTQAIMQNALIKKQLEDQKERFMKKQQERSKSPNPQGNAITMSIANFINASQNGSPSAANVPTNLTPAFTPTSVIRNMINEKAEKQQEEGDLPWSCSPERKPPILKIMRMDSNDDMKPEDEFNSPVANQIIPQIDTPPIMTVAPDGSISIPVPTTPKTPGTGAANTTARNTISNSILSNSQLTQQTAASVQGLPHPSHPQQNLISALSHIQGHPVPPNMPHLQGIPAAVSAANKQPRALFGQGLNVGQSQIMPGNQSVMPIQPIQTQANCQMQPSPPSQLQQGRPIIKGLGAQANMVSPPNQQRGITGILPHQKPDGIPTSQQRPIVGSQQLPAGVPQQAQPQQTPPQGHPQPRPAGATPSPNIPRTSGAPFGAVPGSVPGRVQPQAGVVRPGISPPTNANPVMMSRMVHPAAGSMPNSARGFQQMGVGQLSPLSALQAAQTQAQQRGLDARLQSGRNVYPMGTAGVNHLMAGNANPRGSFPPNMTRALSPQPQMGGPVMSFAKHDGSVSPGIVSHPVMNATNLNALFGSGVENNLAKWFNSDVLKQQTTVMPPLPSQGQRVMTVDEIERRQQMVTN